MNVYSELPFLEPAQVLSAWPEKAPLISFLGHGRFYMVALSFSKLDADAIDQLLQSEVGSHLGGSNKPICPFQGGYVGIIPYKSDDPKLVFKVKKTLIGDMVNKKTYIFSTVDENHLASWSLEDSEILALWSQSNQRSLPNPESIKLKAQQSDQEYLKACQSALEMIRAGRFSQINLLRFFSLPHPLSRQALIAKLLVSGGEQSIYFEEGQKVVASFSPERFLRLQGPKIEAFPIKGTRPRDPDHDTEKKADLKSSKKDLAELAMIVDLMRNDFNRICRRGSVQVKNYPSVLSTTYVHHLYAEVSGELQDNIRFGDILQAVFPAGSITGAPKEEVMQAISELEKQQRGNFMGNAFYWDPAQNSFDSSVLIRTICAQKDMDGRIYDGEFAAGSGIVLDSVPEEELKEIEAKCRVLL